MELKDLCGLHYLSGIETGNMENEYGESVGYVMLTLDRRTYRLAEDPADGYRSFCKEPEVIDGQCSVVLPDILVRCAHIDNRGRFRDSDDDLLLVIDVDSNLPILIVGTENFGDIYPECIMEYTPENMAINRTTKAKEENLC